MLCTILKQSKTDCYNYYFETNCNNIKNIWKGLKSILNIKAFLLISLRLLLLMVLLFPIQWKSQTFSTTIFLPLNTKRKLNVSFLHKHVSDFLKNRSNISFFVSPTNKTENVISSLDSNKSVGPNSTPTKILKLHENDISSKLSEKFIISLPLVSFLQY